MIDAGPPSELTQPPAETVDIAVLGGGLVGVCIALALRDARHDVLLVDRGAPERAASFGNAGVVSRGSIFPVVGAGALKQLPRWLLGLEPGVRLPWRYLPGLTPFGLALLRTLSPDRQERAIQALDALCSRAAGAHRSLLERAGKADNLRPTGFLNVYRDRAAFDAAAPARDRLMRSQVRVETFDTDDLADLEPGLAGGYAVGSLVTDSLSVADPGGVCASYTALFQQEGGRRLTAEVTGVTRGRPWQVATSAGPVRARQVVVALGAWTKAVLAPLGHRLPLVAERGYHAHFVPTGPGLGRPVNDVQGGFVVAPQSRGLRLTTGTELAPIGAPPTPRQLARVLPSARKRLPLGDQVGSVWMGGRPTLPDSIPAIGRVPGEDGLWLAVGHQHIGFSLSAITGAVMAALIDNRTPPIDPAPYDPARWLGQ